MKKSILILFLFVAVTLHAQNTKLEVLKEFVSGFVNFNDEFADLGQPIVTINNLAEEQADKTIELTKDNTKQTLEIAKGYKACFITVGVHTIVKVTDFEDCSPSGAWGACMPKGKGYVQKSGVLHEKEDYIKNIIGRPGNQVRKVFLFN